MTNLRKIPISQLLLLDKAVTAIYYNLLPYCLFFEEFGHIHFDGLMGMGSVHKEIQRELRLRYPKYDNLHVFDSIKDTE